VAACSLAVLRAASCGCCLLLVHVLPTGLYTQAFKTAPPSVTEAAASHFVERKGLADPSLMEMWMTAAAAADSSKPSLVVTQLVGRGTLGAVSGVAGAVGAACVAACDSTVSVAACVSSSDDGTSEERSKH
jgi:hypothetical protein